MKQSSTGIRIVGSCVFVAAILFTALTPRSSLAELFLSYGIAFALYLMVLLKKQHWRWWLCVGLIARFLLIFIFPHLSDDVYRFFWDGSLTGMGINPFSILPSQFEGTYGALPAELSPVYPLLNSPHYYTVYPAICQVFFALPVYFSGSDIHLFSGFLKGVFFLFECGTLRLLYLLLRDQDREVDITYYALNPLVIIELTGNLHFEAIMIFMLTGMYWLLKQEKIMASAGMLALAVGTKLIPLLFLPFLSRRMPISRFMAFAGVAILLIGLLFTPVLLTSRVDGFLSSLDLYFRKFEFNASFYYLFRWLGYVRHGFNTIATTGPLLALSAVCILGVYWIREKEPSIENLPVAIIASLTIYLLLSTTVHPWYICTLVAFSTLTHLRYPIIWSGLIFLSYATYRTDPSQEVHWLIALEYVIVIGWMIREWKSKKQGVWIKSERE